jgi:carboxypeptidase T
LIEAKNKYERTRLSEIGVDVEGLRDQKIFTTASELQIRQISNEGFKVQTLDSHFFDDFPSKDQKFHNYDELQKELRALEKDHPELLKIESIGKTWENRDQWAVHFNTSPSELKSKSSSKPGIVFLGQHHAREHLSLEVPLMLAQYLATHSKEPALSKLLNQRDIWIIPQVNPDGSEFDIESGKYQYWRKNKRDNQNGTNGVDLNRNYGYQWGTGGSSSTSSSDTYMGPSPFSEPETQNVKRFIDQRPNMRILLSFHTYSELILYPWGYTYDPIVKEKDRKVFETMAKTMAKWNHYTPQQASDLYIASGVTDDWAYGTHGIFAFTFELTPKSVIGGGFYPGQRAIDPTFRANLKPCLYLIENAGNPYQVLTLSTEQNFSSDYGYLGPKQQDFFDHNGIEHVIR